jgi:ABC-2 type transport system permease protein
MTDGTHRYSYLEPVFDDDLKPTGAFRSFTRTKTGVDTAQVWWLLAPQPFAVLADATPRWRPRIDPDTNAFHPLEAGKYDPLSVIRDGVRDARTTRDEFADFDPYLLMGRTVDHYLEPAPTWPVGMLSDVLLGTGVALLRIRRLRRGPRRAAAERAPATTPTAP